MVTIRINEFEGYGLDEFKLFLKESEDNIYEIVIPKEASFADSTNTDIAWEFFSGAYIGQRLYEISSEFGYVTAQPGHPGTFGFNLQTKKVNQLADFLFQASGAFGNTAVTEPFDFALDIGAFIADFTNRQVICQDMFDIASGYRSQKDE
jgi:hypothetical protein